jgi:hypothetical protein
MFMRIFASIFTLVFAALLFATPSHAQKIELYGGYSFTHAPVTFLQTAPFCPFQGCPTAANTQHLNLNGWEVSAASKVLGPLALAAEYSDTSGTHQGSNTHLKTYLFGPQLRFPGPISPFAHVLVGGAHESVGSSTNPVFTAATTQNGFAATLGAGLDLKLLPLLSLRPIEIDYLLTHFNSTTQNQPRFSAGVVLRF